MGRQVVGRDRAAVDRKEGVGGKGRALVAVDERAALHQAFAPACFCACDVLRRFKRMNDRYIADLSIENEVDSDR